MPQVPQEYGTGQRGITLLELVVAVGVIAVLAAILLDRLLYYQEFAEKTAMEVTAENIRTELRFRLGELIAKQDQVAIAHLAAENPIHWLERPPPNYAGELRAPALEEAPPGSWYFDTASSRLVYRPNRSGHFVGGQPGEIPEVHYRTVVWPQAGAIDGVKPRAEWARLELVSAYSWF